MEEKQETGLGESNEDIRENDSPEETALPAEAGAVAPADGDADDVTLEPVGDPAAESAGVAPDVSPDTENGAGKPGQNAIGSLLDYLEIFAFSVAAVLVVFTMLFRLCRVDGSSMRKTLENGQMLITTSVGEPEPGDIIVFSMTTDSPYYDLNEALVKRVIAKGGQTVRIDCQTGTVFVDGKQLTERYAVLLDSAGHDSGVVQQYPTYGYDRETRIFEVTVPECHLFVMGDNRNHSTDSRTTIVGMVDGRRVLGRVILRLSPFTTDFD